jgi:beta-lactam-binding protein with PASTA domain
MTRLHVALGIAGGFLVGLIVVVVLGIGVGGHSRTVTVARTVIVPAKAITTGGTVIVTTLVPPLVGERLDVAKDRLRRAGFDPDVKGGGLFGVIKASNWDVVTQDPPPGTRLEQGSSVHLRIERR